MPTDNIANADVDEVEVQQLLEQQAAIQARLAAIMPSHSSSASSLPGRTPIHKQRHQRHGARSLSIGGPLPSQRTPIVQSIHAAIDRPRHFSQQATVTAAAPSMSRAASHGLISPRTGVNPFSSNGRSVPPPVQSSDVRIDNSMVDNWAANQDQPLSLFTLAHQSASQYSPPQAPMQNDFNNDLRMEDPAAWLQRTDPSMTSIAPSPTIMIGSQNFDSNNQDLSALQQTSAFSSPCTPASETLTNATTITSDEMSRQNSGFSDFPIRGGLQMLKVGSHNSTFTDNYLDENVVDLSPFGSSPVMICSSSDEQSRLLVGAGGVGQDSNFSPYIGSLDAGQSLYPPYAAEIMQRTDSLDSNASCSSTSSTAARSKEQLKRQIQLASRPLAPKAGTDETPMSRQASSQLMVRIPSNDGSDDKLVAQIPKAPYQRPKHERVYCVQCSEFPDGFRGEHELRRHVDRQHKPLVKKFVCIEPTDRSTDHPTPLVPLSKCKACATQKKRYGAYYNAAAHLRRAHFNPKARGRGKNAKADGKQEKRGGKGGGDWPDMNELKHWMKEVMEEATENQPQDDGEVNDEKVHHPFDNNHMVPNLNFEQVAAPPIIGLYPTSNLNYQSHQLNVCQPIPFDQSQGFDQFGLMHGMPYIDHFSQHLNDQALGQNFVPFPIM